MTDTKGTKTVSSSEFVQLLRKEIPGETEAAGTLLLSFEMLGRSVVGGIAYHRDGGPNDEIKRLATLVMAMGGMAVEAARRHPRGWVVVDAFGRPCCHPEEGRTEFHPSGEIIIFGNEEESARFAARVNAQPGDDPALPALSLSAQRFATEATRHAEMYRRFISDEQISLDA